MKPIRVLADEEVMPFADEQFDLIISNLSLHWINDLPGYCRVFKDFRRCLKPDGLFLGSMCGEKTLQELRNSISLAETEREGSYSAHISPFTRVSDMGNMLMRAKFALPTVDTEDILIGYTDIVSLMKDLKGMGENNANLNRRGYISRDVLAAAAAIYQSLYGNKRGLGVTATYQIVYMIGWAPHESQPKPLARGSGKVHLSQVEDMKLGDIGVKKEHACRSTTGNQDEAQGQAPAPQEDDQDKLPHSDDFVIKRLSDMGDLFKKK